MRENCRRSLRDLGRQTGLSAPAVTARLKRLEQAGVIASYTIAIRGSSCGLGFEALIFVRVTPASEDAFREDMRNTPAVSSCEGITGEYTHVIRASFAGVPELDAFLQRAGRLYGPCLASLVLRQEFPPRPALAPAGSGHKTEDTP